MFDNSGKPTLIEVNSNFGWKIQKITGVNIAKHIVEYVVMQSEIKESKPNTTNNYSIFEQSEYLHNSFKKLKGETLKYTDRNGKRNFTEISHITDLYRIIENTIKIA